MKEKNELSYRDLKMICNQDMFKFDTTQELEPINDGIGQERGIKALEFGIDVNVKGYRRTKWSRKNYVCQELLRQYCTKKESSK